MAIHPIIRQIIARDCHVGSSNRAVIRHVVSRLRAKYATFRAMPPADRKAFLRQCVAAHAENQATYSFVMRGR
jgi:uncharacterized protein YlxP (DUF503 family)